MASVKLILILHPSGAAENVKKLSLPQVKNLACGLGKAVNGCRSYTSRKINAVTSGVRIELRRKSLNFPLIR